MKTCFKCGITKSESDFYRHPNMADGLLGKCKECTKRDSRANYRNSFESRQAYERERSKTPERRKKALEYQKRRRSRTPEKSKARDLVAQALRRGEIQRRPCEACGAKDSEAHHRDYGKPLEVVWLCFVCHRKEHGQLQHPNAIENSTHVRP